MRRAFAYLLTVAIATAATTAQGGSALAKGKPEIRSMSALAFGPDGVLFVGDSRAGAVFALDLGDNTQREVSSSSCPNRSTRPCCTG